MKVVISEKVRPPSEDAINLKSGYIKKNDSYFVEEHSFKVVITKKKGESRDHISSASVI